MVNDIWTLEFAVNQIHESGYIMDIGQIPKTTINKLNNLVKQGKLRKGRESWCGISQLKTVYYACE